MAPDRLRTVSIDLPDALVRRVARHVGRSGTDSFSIVVRQALEAWAERAEAAEPAASEAGTIRLERTGTRRREAV